jgi:putative PIN family toxin of toxin-antitoxin system
VKIVLDTNVLVSGLLRSDGNPAQVLALALAGSVQLCHDKRVLAEYGEVLSRPRFKFDPKRVREVLTTIELDGLAVDTAAYDDLDLPDPDDVPFLAVALAASVDFLVTGNLADYPPDKRRGCSVLSPAAFVRHWNDLQNED